MPIMVKKFNGTTQPFSEEKLFQSMVRAGASKLMAEQVVKRIRR